MGNRRVPADSKQSSVTFVVAGGLGYSSQPKTAGFVFLVNGRETARFDLADLAAKWASADCKVELRFVPRRHIPQDCLGIFYAVISSDVKPGEPCRWAFARWAAAAGDGSDSVHTATRNSHSFLRHIIRVAIGYSVIQEMAGPARQAGHHFSSPFACVIPEIASVCSRGGSFASRQML